MRVQLLSTLASLTLIGASFEASPVLAPAGSATAAPTTLDDGDEALHEAMEGMQSGMRSLRKLMSADGAEEALQTIRAMQGHTLTSFAHVPPVAEDADAATRKTWSTDYKKRMLQLGIALVELEELVIAGDFEAAKTAYKGLSEHKKQGHDKYYPE